MRAKHRSELMEADSCVCPNLLYLLYMYSITHPTHHALLPSYQSVLSPSCPVAIYMYMVCTVYSAISLWGVGGWVMNKKKTFHSEKNCWH